MKQKKNKDSVVNRKYAIGIDLGTTNSALAYVELLNETAVIETLEIPQFTAAATIENKKALPSFLYLATEDEVSSNACNFEWTEKRDYLVGEFARNRSAETPGRSIAAAKSWLCHSRVDRRSPILPWNAVEDITKISPVEVSRRYLAHLTDSWNQKFVDFPFNEQLVVITVPASFDASGRELTAEAAREAGYPEDFVLLEEPVAALYSWLVDLGEKWRKELKVGDTILVCDVGGGTSDFSLISVKEQDGALTLERAAVGNHILVGGDNMDIALAHFVKAEFEKKDIQLDAWQSISLWHSCRAVKEILLAEDGPDAYPVTILGRGSKLIGGTLSCDLEKKTVYDFLINGFFPECKIDDTPIRKPSAGFRELGLPYETDAAITRHLSGFLNLNSEKKGEAVRPNYILFNGGVFKASAFRQRILDVFSQWYEKEEAVKELAGSRDFDFAVARGGAYYAAAKQGKGIRIRGGVGKSYYVGIETSGPAVPGIERPMQALCVIPFGMEEGTEIDVPSIEIGLITGEKAVFRFFNSSIRKHDKPGDILPSVKSDDIFETDSIIAELPASERFSDGFTPVKFFVKVTELGVLELWCKSAVSEDKWKLEFKVRED